MAQLNFDANQVKPDEGFSILPPGWYNTAIDESEMKPTKAGDGAYLKLRFNILDGAYAGKKFFHNLNLQNPNQTAVEIAQGQLSAICRAVGVMQLQDSQQLHGVPLKIKVKIRPPKGDYDESNDITTFKNINEPVETVGGKGGSQGAPQQGFEQQQPQQQPAQQNVQQQNAQQQQPAQQNVQQQNAQQQQPAQNQPANTWQQPDTQQPWQNPDQQQNQNQGQQPAQNGAGVSQNQPTQQNDPNAGNGNQPVVNVNQNQQQPQQEQQPQQTSWNQNQNNPQQGNESAPWNQQN